MNLMTIQSNPVSPSKSVSSRRSAFTLIELLVVIGVIAALAALTVYGLSSIAVSRKISTAKGELRDIDAAIVNYKAKYGVYPPGNGTGNTISGLTNQLYYELTGVSIVNVGGQNYFQTVDGSSKILVSDFNTVFGVPGVLNCTKGSGEDALPAVNFLAGMKANRVGLVTAAALPNSPKYNLLITTVAGPDDAYQPVGSVGINPFRYKAPSATNNNADSYDLWINLSMSATNFSGATKPQNLRLISNWAKADQKSSQMP